MKFLLINKSAVYEYHNAFEIHYITIVGWIISRILVRVRNAASLIYINFYYHVGINIYYENPITHLFVLIPMYFY